MYTLKGFINYNNLINNELDEVAFFGELSEDSKTFSMDKQWHSDAALSKDAVIVGFTSLNDGTNIVIPADIGDMSLRIAQWMMDRNTAGDMPQTSQLLEAQLMAEFTPNLVNIIAGDMSSDGTNTFPASLTFVVANASLENKVTLWLTDVAFSNQYDDYFIKVIPPIEPLDDFFKSIGEVKDLLGEYSFSRKIDEAQQQRGKYPYTVIRVPMYSYVNVNNTADRTDTSWIVMVYGAAGNNPDVIRQSIVDYVLANSSHSEDEWKRILPDLFKSVEFIITPLFTKYSLPYGEFQAGMYSPIFDPATDLPLLQRTARGIGYSDEYVANNYQSTAVLYKSLAFGVIGNPDNTDDLNKFSAKWPEYILVTNTSPDFNRVNTSTQRFIELLNELILAAEQLDDNTRLPVGVSRITRDGIKYVAATFESFNYLVVSKESVEAFTQQVTEWRD